MQIAKVSKNISLHPEIAEAMDSVCETEGISFPVFIATDRRIKRWFADRHREVPGPKTRGRPLKPREIKPEGQHDS